MTQRQVLETMQLQVIQKYGHENRKTIRFCRICENHPNGGWLVRHTYNKLMSK